MLKFGFKKGNQRFKFTNVSSCHNTLTFNSLFNHRSCEIPFSHSCLYPYQKKFQTLVWGNLSLGNPFAHIKNINIHDKTWVLCESPRIFKFSMTLILHESHPFWYSHSILVNFAKYLSIKIEKWNMFEQILSK
jgi:hypothetical protein